MAKRWIVVGVAIALLVGGYIYGKNAHRMDEEAALDYYRQLLPEAEYFVPMTDTTAQAFDAGGELIAYVGISSGNGYGGPILVGTILYPSGKLGEPVILSHNETPSFLARLSGRYYSQYKDKSADSILMLGEDLDTVSGATLSSRAISDSVRESAHSIARTAFGLNPQQPAVKWQFGMKEFVAILMFAAGFVIYKVKKFQKYRLILLSTSVILLGFWINRALSVAQFTSLLLGYLPSPKVNLLFYIVVIGALAPILFTGKNLYCTYICPFCGLQELANKVTGKNISLGKARKWLSMLRNLLLFVVLMGAMVTATATFITYEPFGAIFSLDLNVETYLLFITIASLTASFFFRRLWCIGFCPAGAFLDVFRDLVNDIRKKLFRRKNAASSKASEEAL